jgi:hypothetical protein
MGLPALYDEGECIAVEISCSDEAHLRMQERLGVHRDVVLDLQPGIFPPSLPPHEIQRLIAAQPLPARELAEIIQMANTLDRGDAQTLANIITRLSEIQDGEGEAAAFNAIDSLGAVLTPNNTPQRTRARLTLVDRQQ